MKKIIMLFLVIILLSGCYGNKDIFDDISPSSNVWKYAEIQMPDGTIKEGKVKSWSDYENGDALKIIFEDGTQVMTSYNKCILSKEKVKR